MQSAEDRRRLMSQLGGESITPLGAALKCAVGILVLVIIAAGPWMFLSASGPTAAPVAAEPTTPTRANRPLPSNLAESKRVFDERRSAYESSRQARVPGLAIQEAGPLVAAE